MKTIEEKAQAYDRAVEEISKLRDVLLKEEIIGEYGIINTSFERIFPELKESSDEKVKRILHSISSKISFHLHDIFTEEEFQCFDTWYNVWLEKQGEQKPADKVKSTTSSYITPNPKFFQWIYDRLKYVHNEDPDVDYMRSLKDRIEGMQKPAWSEEDEKIIETLLRLVRDYNWKRITCGFVGADKETVLSWLNSLKDIVLPLNIAYYNPYKEVVESIAEMCKHYDKISHSGLRDFYDNVKVKCKDAKEYDSLYPQEIDEQIETIAMHLDNCGDTAMAEILRSCNLCPQNRWKPSDEQMKALSDINITGCVSYAGQGQELVNLYNDLKKLREE